jgi:O-methyltransferase
VNEFESLYKRACERVNRLQIPAQMERAEALIEQLRMTGGSLPVAECGVFTGLTAFLLCESMGESEYHGFDSFEGLEPGENDDHSYRICKKGFFAKSPKYAQSVLAEKKAAIHVGHIPEILNKQPDRTYRFVHVDVDCYEATLQSLRYFWPRLMDGGIMVCDDCSLWKGAKKACDEFGVLYQVIPTGQAVWVKP